MKLSFYLIVVLLLGLSFGFGGGYFFSEKNYDLKVAREQLEARMDHIDHMEGHAMVHEKFEATEPYPRVRLVLHKEPTNEYAVEVQLENFQFAPEHAGGEHVPGEGHAHLYIDGEKVARLYGSWFHLGAIPADTQTISVRLSTNDHRELVRDGEPISFVLPFITALRFPCSVHPFADYTVCYTKNGYVPSDMTIQKGEVVAFVRDTAASAMWTASDAHPTHTDYTATDIETHCPRHDEMVFDQCSDGDEFIFQFNQEGTWQYHNHSLSVHGGTVHVIP